MAGFDYIIPILLHFEPLFKEQQKEKMDASARRIRRGETVKRKRWLLTLTATLVLAVLSVWIGTKGMSGTTFRSAAYSAAVEHGYTGTPEEWIAALAGETALENGSTSETAYDLACKKGYDASFDTWMTSLTEKTTEDQTQSAFGLIQANGYTGTLEQWLNGLVEHPEMLGHSNRNRETEFELACKYGFEGTYIAWIVSLINN